MNATPTTYATDREAVEAALADIHEKRPDVLDHRELFLVRAVINDHLSRVAPSKPAQDDPGEYTSRRKVDAWLERNLPAPPKPAAVGDGELLALGEYPPWARHVAHSIILDSVGHVNVHYYATMAKRICVALVEVATPAPSGPAQAETEQAVERAAESLYHDTSAPNEPLWREFKDEEARNYWRARARRTLLAAYPAP